MLKETFESLDKKLTAEISQTYENGPILVECFIWRSDGTVRSTDPMRTKSEIAARAVAERWTESRAWAEEWNPGGIF